MKKWIKHRVSEIFARADVQINGNRPWDIRIFNDSFYRQIIFNGSLGFGDSYIDKWWDVDQLDQLFFKLLRANLNEKFKGFPDFKMAIEAKLCNLQKKSKAYEIGKRHYDIGNDLYSYMLDKGMNYSCGFWKNAENLDQAQKAKLELICDKLGIESGMKVLDVGCGWGGFAKYAASKYNINVVGITVSKEQVRMAQEVCENLPVDIRLQDYRDLDRNEKFDRIVSIGMIEHVGHKNYRDFLKIVKQCLQDDGLFLLQTIGSNKAMKSGEPWLQKYIFPDGQLPSPVHLSKAIEGLFIIEDWHNFGADYDKTLMAWYKNFESNWYKIKENKKYDERFYRIWKYYLLSCAGIVRARELQLWQIVLSKKGIVGGYDYVRK